MSAMVPSEAEKRRAEAYIRNAKKHQGRAFRGRYILRHKGKVLRKHALNEAFDTIRVPTMEQALETVAQLSSELDQRIRDSIRPLIRMRDAGRPKDPSPFSQFRRYLRYMAALHGYHLDPNIADRLIHEHQKEKAGTHSDVLGTVERDS